MRLVFLALLFSAFVFRPLPAQEIEVTATGTLVNGVYGFDSSVHAGTQFTWNYLINAQTPAISETGTEALYSDPSELFSISFGDYTFSNLAGTSNASILSNNAGEYGYDLTFAATTAQNGFGNISSYIDLLSEATELAPTTALNSIQQVSMTNFFPGSTNFNFYASSIAGGNSARILGTVSSYTVEYVPEPVMNFLLILGVLTVGLKFYLNRRTSK